ncbi:MAG: hypothetical protein GY830_06015 [Bacteroidetes bacterium]|nr:hypothetical protein [Bacteroidota bacterium]
MIFPNAYNKINIVSGASKSFNGTKTLKNRKVRGIDAGSLSDISTSVKPIKKNTKSKKEKKIKKVSFEKSIAMRGYSLHNNNVKSSEIKSKYFD